MKILSLLFILLFISISGCNTENAQPGFKTGEGVELYLAKHNNPYDYLINYATINLDTIQIQEDPLINYNHIKRYNLTDHTAELTVPAENINKFQPHVFGHMFVMTVDKEKVYCGFIFPSISSAIPKWVMISEPFGDAKKENKLPIHFIHPQKSLDPRADNRIINRLQKDGKLID